MGKKKNGKSLSLRTPVAASTHPFQSWDEPEKALAWWRENLLGVFSPRALESALDSLEPDIHRRGVLGSLSRLAGNWFPVCGLSGPKWKPAAVLHDSQSGRLFVAGASHEGLGCFDSSSGRSVWSLPAGTLGRAGGMALAGGSLYVCDRWANHILRLDPDSGAARGRIEKSTTGRVLDEPSDILPVEVGGAVELWVCERGGHRVLRYCAEGNCIGSIGARGLAIEEIIQRFTRPPGESENLLFEFPESLCLARDIDGSQSVFVWDCYNRRLAVLGLDGSFKRSIRLIPENKPLFCGQVRVYSGPAGPLLLGIDDCNNCLNVWDHEGNPLIRVSLRELSEDGKLAESLRFVAGEKNPVMLSSRGKLTQVGVALSDIRILLDSLVRLFPERFDLRLSLCELNANAGPLAWDQAFPSLVPETVAESLLQPGNTLDRGLTRTATRLEALTVRLGDSGESTTLAAAIRERLRCLAAETEQKLLGLALPSESCLDSWSEALASLDMSLVQTKGKNQHEEMALDDTLEEIREYPDTLRHTAWTLRGLLSVLLSLRALDTNGMAGRLTETAVALLEQRRKTLSTLTARLDLAGDPTHVRRDELLAIHRALLLCNSLELVSSHLADCVRDNPMDVNALPPETWARFSRLAVLDSPTGHWRGFAGTIGLPDTGPARDKQSETETLESPSAIDKFRSLNENMSRYLAALNRAGGTGGPFGRVVARQREIFAIKSSLLVNAIFRNGSTPAEALELAGHASCMAGAAWNSTLNLRLAPDSGEFG